MVDIILTTHNRCELLKRTLQSIFDKTTKIPYRLFIIDDCSDDGTKEYLLSLKADCIKQIVFNQERKGVVWGFNALFALVNLYDAFYEEYPYMCYIQDDVLIYENGWLLKLIRAYEIMKHDYRIGFFCGFDAPEHFILKEIRWNGVNALIKRSTRATNLIAEKSFWKSIGYVPRLNPNGQPRGFPSQNMGSHIDLYLTGCGAYSRFYPDSSADNSLHNQNKFVLVLPGLIAHMAESERSTWRHG